MILAADTYCILKSATENCKPKVEKEQYSKVTCIEILST